MDLIFAYGTPVLLFTVLVSYLCGSIPSGMIISKKFGISDLRKNGSGNIGATNAWRVGGKKIGILTFAFDVTKSLVPTLIFSYYLNTSIATLAGLITVTGHVFPVWLRFKGGKGVAPMFGFLFAVTPHIAIISGLSWLIAFKAYRTASISSLVAVCVAFCVSLTTHTLFLIVLHSILLLLIFISHRSNIIAIINNSEKSFK